MEYKGLAAQRRAARREHRKYGAPKTPYKEKTLQNKAHQKIYVGRNESAILVCPECQRTMMLDCREYIDAEGKVHIRHSCACGHSNLVLLERRQSLRKTIRLLGFYAPASGGRLQRMTVENLSRSGLKFETEHAASLRIGDELMVGFHLEDDVRTYVRKKVVIRKRPDAGHFHADFIPSMKDPPPSEEAGDRAIANYLISQT
jgi:hypothetical protein